MEELDELGVPIRRQQSPDHLINQPTATDTDDLGVPIRKKSPSSSQPVAGDTGSLVRLAPGKGPSSKPTAKAGSADVPTVEARLDLVRTPYQLENDRREKALKAESDSDPLGALSAAGHRIGNLGSDLVESVKDMAKTAAPALLHGAALLTPEHALSVGPGGYVPVDPELDKRLSEARKENIATGIARMDAARKESAVRPIIRRYQEIENPGDAMSYAVTAIGQQIPQVALSLGSAGIASILQETANNHADGVEAIAQKEGISPQEVLARGLDKPATAIAFGTVQGLLDRIGAGKLAKIAKSSPAYKKALDMLVEMGTEIAQGRLNKVATGQATGESIGASLVKNPEEMGDEALQSLIVGGAASAIGGTSPADAQSPAIAESPQAESIPEADNQDVTDSALASEPDPKAAEYDQYLHALSPQALAEEHAYASARAPELLPHIEQNAAERAIPLPPQSDGNSHPVLVPESDPGAGDAHADAATEVPQSPDEQGLESPDGLLPPGADTQASAISGPITPQPDESQSINLPADNAIIEPGSPDQPAPGQYPEPDQSLPEPTLPEPAPLPVAQPLPSEESVDSSATLRSDARRMSKPQFMAKHPSISGDAYEDLRDGVSQESRLQRFVDEVFDSSEVKPVTDWIRSKKSGKKGTLQSANPMDLLLEAVAQGIEAGHAIRQAVKIGIRELKKSGISAVDAQSLADGFLSQLNDVPKSSAIFDGVINRGQKTAELRSDFRDFVTTLRNKDRNAAIEDRRKQVIGYLNTNRKAFVGRLGAARMRTALAMVNNVKTDKSLQSALHYLGKLLANVRHDTSLAEAKSARAKVRAAAKSKSLPQNMRSSLRDFLSLDPNTVSDPETYSDLAERIAADATGKSANHTVTEAEIRAYSSAEQAHALAEEKKDLLADHPDLVEAGVLDASMPLEEIYAVMDGIDPAKKNASAKFRVRTQLTDNIKQLEYEFHLLAQSDPVLDKLFNLSLDQLNIPQLRLLQQLVNNIAHNGDYSGVNILLNKQKALDITKELTPQLKGIVRDIVWAANKVTQFIGNNLVLKMANEGAIYERLSGVRQAGNAVYESVMGDVNRGFIRSKIAYEDAAKTLNRLVGKMKDNQLRHAGMVAFLNQHLGGTPEERQAQFEQGKKLLQSSIGNLKKSAKTRALGEREQAIFDQYIARASAPAELENSLSKEQQALYNWALRWYDSQKDAMRMNTEQTHNEEFTEWENYIPRKTQAIRTTVAEDFELGESAFTKARIPKTPIGRSKQRVADKTLADNRYYETNLAKLWQQTAFEILLDKHTLNARQVAQQVLTDPDFISAVGKDNADILLTRATETALAQKGFRYQSDLARFLAPLKNVAVTTMLGRPEKLITETIPQYVQFLVGNPNSSTLLRVFAQTGMGLNENGKAMNAMLEKLDANILIRSTQGDADLDAKLENAFSEGVLAQSGEKVMTALGKVQELSTLSLHVGDKQVSKYIWVASYINALVEGGHLKSAGDFDFQNPALDNTAATQANRAVDKINNVSNSTTQGSLFNAKSQTDSILSNLAFPLKKFAANQSVELGLALRNIIESHGRDAASFRQVAGLMAGSVTFALLGNYLRAPMYAFVADGILNALGYAGDDEDKKKEQAAKLRREEALPTEVTTKVLSDMALGWMPVQVETLLKKAIEEKRRNTVRNTAYQSAIERGASPAEANKESSAAVFDSSAWFYDRPTGASDMLGAYGFLFDKAGEISSTLQDLRLPEEALSDRAVAGVYVKLLGMTGLLDGGTVEINRRVSKVIEKKKGRLKSFTTTYIDDTPGDDGRKKDDSRASSRGSDIPERTVIK